jgi:hypothetical protein
MLALRRAVRSALTVIPLAAALGVGARSARAQGPPGPPLPVGMDMRKAPVGGWSAYEINLKGMPPLKQRFSLVGRDAATSTIELTTEGGMMGAGNTVVLRVVLAADLSRPDRVKKLIMQLGDNPPMELNSEAAAAQKEQFAPLDPRKLVGSEKVKVPAGTIATRHYRDRSASGRTDVWVSDEAPPFGIVKLEGTVSEGKGTASYPVTVALVAHGTDARPVVVKPPQPFDPNVLQGQMTRALSAPRAPSSPPGPAPAPRGAK